MIQNVFDTFKKGLEDVDATLEDLNPKEHQLGEITELVNRKLDLESQVAILTENLNSLNQKLEKLNSVEIPEKMQELGLAKIITESGAEVTINKIYRGNLGTHAEHVLKWFIETKQADSIKNKFEISLGVGDAKKASELTQILSTAGFNYNNKKDIAWNTLASIIKDLEVNDNLNDNQAWWKLQEEGKVPQDLSLKEALGVFTKYETKLKFKK